MFFVLKALHAAQANHQSAVDDKDWEKMPALVSLNLASHNNDEIAALVISGEIEGVVLEEVRLNTLVRRSND